MKLKHSLGSYTNENTKNGVALEDDFEKDFIKLLAKFLFKRQWRKLETK